MSYVTRQQRKEQRKNRRKKVIIILVVVLFLCASAATVWLIFRNRSERTAENAGMDVPDYADSSYVEVNGNVPYFTDEDKARSTFESYSELDSLGRCGVAYACVSRELMPTEERGQIGNVKPTGWVQAKYEGVVDSSPPYLYNRCHLIAYCLTAENANEKNLITGTRYMNVKGMLPFEEKVAKYLDQNDNHVLYRVTPDFRGKNLLANGVLIEAYSIEDHGEGICFCVYCYNVQPGVSIDYKTGENRLTGRNPEVQYERNCRWLDIYDKRGRFVIES